MLYSVECVKKKTQTQRLHQNHQNHRTLHIFSNICWTWKIWFCLFIYLFIQSFSSIPDRTTDQSTKQPTDHHHHHHHRGKEIIQKTLNTEAHHSSVVFIYSQCLVIKTRPHIFPSLHCCIYIYPAPFVPKIFLIMKLNSYWQIYSIQESECSGYNKKKVLNGFLEADIKYI